MELSSFSVQGSPLISNPTRYSEPKRIFLGGLVYTLELLTAMADEKILSYNDVVLRRSDLDILSGPYFLNDRIIEFYFSYLASCYPSEDILLIPPGIAFWIKECPDITSVKDVVDPLRLSQRKLIMFPINDNADVNLAEGGSHWSLLAFDRNYDLFVHHDSSGRSCNSSHAGKVFGVVRSLTTSISLYVECPHMPKQQNGYDCGLYVTAVARVICEWYGSNGPNNIKGLWFSALKERVTPSFVSNMRSEILELVQSLMVKQDGTCEKSNGEIVL